MSEQEVSVLRHGYDVAMINVRKFNTPSADGVASAAYQRLVKAGEAPPLREKYRTARVTKYAGGERGATPKHRHKINDKAKQMLAPQPKRTLVVDGLTGKSRMENAA